ncbi:MAG TPA: hypothetical protein VHY48_13785 [Acidobacteriaceae bacterium]|jgi:hypothetical protein|nr:hypothetical protein [Acidobacteriaceae bacterium]
MSSARKKVIVRRFGDQLSWGYLPQDHPAHEGQIELIDTAARVSPLPLRQIKWVAYVRDFNLTDPTAPERLDRRRFSARPRTEGLWVRLHFTDGDVLEGLLQVNAVLLEALAESQGLFLIPPDTRANTQRLFIPRRAIQSIEPLGLVQPRSAKAQLGQLAPQPTLFPEEATR